jgi:hypothetical protein
MKAPRKAQLSLLAALSIVVLAGCSVSVGGASVEPDDLSELVATQLQKTVPDAAPPIIDCGDEKISAEVDKVVHCNLTDAEGTDDYDVAVTFTSVEDTTYAVDIKVGDTPK